jgi:hypothetical protein
MSPATIEYLAAALADEKTVTRYWSHVRKVENADGRGCWWWTGALSGKGHGRFHLATEQTTLLGPRRTFTIIAHRFGYALTCGLDALLGVPVVAHRCDNPACQRPTHWRESTPSLNRADYHARRDVVLSALADTRGARGRVVALRQVLRDGGGLSALNAAMRDGAPDGHPQQAALFELSAHQLTLFDAPEAHAPAAAPAA